MWALAARIRGDTEQIARELLQCGDVAPSVAATAQEATEQAAFDPWAKVAAAQHGQGVLRDAPRGHEAHRQGELGSFATPGRSDRTGQVGTSPSPHSKDDDGKQMQEQAREPQSWQSRVGGLTAQVDEFKQAQLSFASQVSCAICSRGWMA